MRFLDFSLFFDFLQKWWILRPLQNPVDANIVSQIDPCRQKKNEKKATVRLIVAGPGNGIFRESIPI